MKTSRQCDEKIHKIQIHRIDVVTKYQLCGYKWVTCLQSYAMKFQLNQP